MTVTYKEIRERYQQLENARDKRVDDVKRYAALLVKAYGESLELESATWKTIQGAQKPYVDAGLMFDNKFKSTNINGILLDKQYGLRFFIATVVDDSPRGGETVAVCVRIFIENDILIAEIGDNSKRISVIDGQFDAVCVEIKDCVLMAISDPGLR